MKFFRTSCIMLLACLCFFSFAGAEVTHTHAQLTLTTAEKEILADTDWYTEGNETIFSFSFLPEYIFSCPEMSFSFANGIQPVSSISGETMQEWKNSQMTSERKGHFSGDSFDSAEKLKEYRFSFRDLSFLLFRGSGSTDILSFFTAPDVFSMNPTFILKEFDDGQYLSLSGEWKGNVFMTFSTNKEIPSEPFYVIGYAKNGKNYYWSIRKKERSTSETAYEICIWADDNQTGFKSLRENSLIMTQTWSVQNESLPEEAKYSFHGELVPANGLTSILISGSYEQDAAGFHLEAKAHFEAKELPALTLQIHTDSQPFALHEAEAVDITALTEEARKEFSAEFENRKQEWINLLFKALPEDYLTRLIFLP